MPVRERSAVEKVGIVVGCTPVPAVTFKDWAPAPMAIRPARGSTFRSLKRAILPPQALARPVQYTPEKFRIKPKALTMQCRRPEVLCLFRRAAGPATSLRRYIR